MMHMQMGSRLYAKKPPYFLKEEVISTQKEILKRKREIQNGFNIPISSTNLHSALI